MIRLVKATINRYKCIEKEQSFDVEDNITVLVGMNESGKTSILESLSKAFILRMMMRSSLMRSMIIQENRKRRWIKVV